MNLWRWLPLLVWLLPQVAAASAITLDARSDHHALIPHLDALLDPDGALGVEEAAARAFRPMRELDLGAGRWPGQRQPVVWLRFSIHVPPEHVPGGAAPAAWYLVIGRPYNPGAVYLEEVPGHYRALDTRLDGSGGSFRAQLPVASGTHRIFLRVPAPLTRPSLLHVATAAGQEQLLQRLLTTQGLYLGLMLAMLLINLLVGLLLRDRAQLWYVGFIAASVATFALLTGTASRFLLETVPASATYRLQYACLALAVFAGIQFSRLFLETPRLAPRTDRVMRGFLALTTAVFLAVWVAPDVLSTQAVALLGVLVPLVAISAGVSTLRSGSRWARFYLVGWSFFTVGGLLFALPIPVPFVDGASAFQLSSALEAALFSAALADRLRILRGERARAERALFRSEQRLQAIFDGTVEATWLLDGAGKVLEINDTAKRRWQITTESSRALELPTLPPWRGSERAGALLSDALAKVRAGEQARFEAAFGEQSACWYDVSAKAIEPGLTLVEARDITELKRAELAAARAEKLAALGQLVAGVAHEVNNPNNFLTFNLPILQEYVEATRPYVEAADRDRGGLRLVGLGVDEFYADAATLIGNMKHGAERIAAIVSQLKSYVRHSDETQWEEADVNRVVANAATLARTPLRQSVERFELHLDDTVPRVRMNPGRIEQVLINLLLNAGQAAASTNAARPGRVDVRTRREGDRLVIAVEDNGPGVPEAIRDRIFEPFFTTKAGEQGTGMGLAISQKIVEEHGGTLELSSPAAGGACFLVRLPIT